MISAAIICSFFFFHPDRCLVASSYMPVWLKGSRNNICALLYHPSSAISLVTKSVNHRPSKPARSMNSCATGPTTQIPGGPQKWTHLWNSESHWREGGPRTILVSNPMETIREEVEVFLLASVCLGAEGITTQASRLGRPFPRRQSEESGSLSSFWEGFGVGFKRKLTYLLV